MGGRHISEGPDQPVPWDHARLDPLADAHPSAQQSLDCRDRHARVNGRNSDAFKRRGLCTLSDHRGKVIRSVGAHRTKVVECPISTCAATATAEPGKCGWPSNCVIANLPLRRGYGVCSTHEGRPVAGLCVHSRWERWPESSENPIGAPQAPCRALWLGPHDPMDLRLQKRYTRPGPSVVFGGQFCPPR